MWKHMTCAVSVTRAESGVSSLTPPGHFSWSFLNVFVSECGGISCTASRATFCCCFCLRNCGQQKDGFFVVFISWIKWTQWLNVGLKSIENCDSDSVYFGIVFVIHTSPAYTLDLDIAFISLLLHVSTYTVWYYYINGLKVIMFKWFQNCLRQVLI